MVFFDALGGSCQQFPANPSQSLRGPVNPYRSLFGSLSILILVPLNPKPRAIGLGDSVEANISGFALRPEAVLCEYGDVRPLLVGVLVTPLRIQCFASTLCPKNLAVL